MSLAPRIPVFAFMCGLLPSSVSTLKASEGRPRELFTNSMPWQDKTTLFFNTGPASHLCAFSHAVSLSRWLFFTSSSNVNQFSRLSCVPPSHEAFPTDAISPSLALPEHIIHTSLTVLITCSLTISVHLIS